jgi:hypothetical protein
MDDRLKNIAIAYFKISGDFDPEVATKLFGLKPSRTRKVSNRGGTKSRADHAYWIYSKGYAEGYVLDVYQLSDALAADLLPSCHKICQFTIQYQLKSRFQIAMWISPSPEAVEPSVGFTNKTISLVSEIGAYIDIERYDRLSVSDGDFALNL